MRSDEPLDVSQVSGAAFFNMLLDGGMIFACGWCADVPGADVRRLTPTSAEVPGCRQR